MVDVFVDTNVFLDVMRLRSGWQDSAKVIDKVNKGELSGFVSSLTLTTLFYELKKTLPRDKVLQELRNGLRGFQIADLAKQDLNAILSERWITDLEAHTIVVAPVHIYSMPEIGC